MDFRQSEVLKFLSLYKQYECLWNSHSPDYSQPDMRKSSWIELSTHFGKEVDDLKKKMKHLRNSYNLERKKVENSRNINGIPMYESRLYYFNQMKFLDPIFGFKTYTDQENKDDPLGEPKSISSNHDFTLSDAKVQQTSCSYVDSDGESPEEELITTIVPSDSDGSLNMVQIEAKPAKKRILVNNVLKEQTPKVPKVQPKSNKEATFCAMICSELKLLKSEETYDNVTSDIFTAVKNAKISQRLRNYQSENESKIFNRS